MVLPAAILLARILSFISERSFVSEIELGLSDTVSPGGLRANLFRGIARVLLRGMILLAGVGGIHTGFGFCPEAQMWMRGRDVIHLVAGPSTVAASIESTTRTRTFWIGRHILSMHATLCRRCHFPLRLELLTQSRMMALVAQSRRRVESAVESSDLDEVSESKETPPGRALWQLGPAPDFP